MDTKAKQSTASPGAGKCPLSHPFAYWHGGQFCCPTNIDNNGDPITLDSLSCENGAQVKCLHGKCVNYAGLYLILSCYLFIDMQLIWTSRNVD